MGKVDAFYISLDNPLATYYPGQTISGKVILNLNNDLNHKGIFIQFKGEANVSWSESSGTSDSSDTTWYIDTQTYFDTEIPLLQNPERDDRKKLQAGHHKFTFAYTLPSELPTTVEAANGHIRYTCSSYIYRPWRHNTKYKLAFTVLRLVDLNAIPGIAMPISSHQSKEWFWRSGSILASVTLDKQGYVPGEMIYINAEVNNCTSGRISRTKASLICVITCRVKKNTCVERIVIGKVKHGVVRPQSCDPWMGESIQIPPTYPTLANVDGGLCRVLSCEYILEFNVVPSWLSRDLKFTIPLTIGSVPLVSDFSRFTPKPQVDHPSSDIGLHPPILNIFPNLPSPLYKESYRGKVKIKEKGDRHAIGDLSYIPHYHYYTQSPVPLERPKAN